MEDYFPKEKSLQPFGFRLIIIEKHTRHAHKALISIVKPVQLAKITRAAIEQP
jgi:hypothetical protein